MLIIDKKHINCPNRARLGGAFSEKSRLSTRSAHNEGGAVHNCIENHTKASCPVKANNARNWISYNLNSLRNNPLVLHWWSRSRTDILRNCSDVAKKVSNRLFHGCWTGRVCAESHSANSIASRPDELRSNSKWTRSVSGKMPISAQASSLSPAERTQLTLLVVYSTVCRRN